MTIERKSVSPYEMIQSHSVNDGHYVHMFLEDVRLQLIPLSLNGLEDARFQIMPSDERTVLTVGTLFSDPSQHPFDLRSYRNRDFSDILSTFIAEVGRELAQNGNSFWEIGKVLDGDTNAVTCSKLFWIAGEVTERRNDVRQRFWQKKEGTKRKKEVILPSSSVQAFKLPRALGTVRAQRRRIGILQDASKIMPSFVEQNLSRLEQDPDYKHTDYSRAQFKALAKAMTEWGWIGRFPDDRYTTEFYNYLRQIKFQKVLAVLRESIIRDINALLQRLEIECEIRLHGLKTASEINEVMEQLKTGSISFGEAMNLARS